MLTKIEDFVPNNFYCCLSYNDDILQHTFYFKYKCPFSTGLKLESYYYIVDNKFYNEEATFVIEDRMYTYIFSEVKISEIITYLPRIHPDKILFRKQRIKNLLEI